MNTSVLALKSIRATLAVALGLVILDVPAGIPLHGSSSHLSRLILVVIAAVPWIMAAGALIRWSGPGRLVGRVLVISLIAFTMRFGMHQLGTYDVSSIVDLGWRFEQGQTPFRDFPLTLPPTFTAVVRACWALLGHNWASFVRGNALVTLGLVMTAWRALSRTEFGSKWNELLVSAAVVVPHLAVGHVWHSAMASQIAVVTVICLLAWKNSPTRGSAATLGILLGLLVLSKPNLAGPMTLLSALWIVKYWRSRHLTTLSVSFVSSLATTLVFSKSNPVQVLATTVELLSSRARPTQLMPDGLDGFSRFFFVSTYALLLAALAGSLTAIVCVLTRRGSVVTATFILGSGCALSSVFGMATNWDIKSSDMPLAILGVLLLAWSTRPSGSSRLVVNSARVLVSVIAVVLTVMSLAVGSTRWRMELAGPMTQPEATAELRGRVLDGVHAAPILQAVDQQLTQALAESDDRNLFLGPRLEIFYSRFRLESPKGLPLWWHSGTSYTTHDMNGVTAAFRSAGFSRAIFFKQDFTRFPPELREIIDRSYVIDERYSQLTIFWARED